MNLFSYYYKWWDIIDNNYEMYSILEDIKLIVVIIIKN